MVLLKPLLFLGMGVSSNKIKYIQKQSNQIKPTDAQTAQVQLCGEESGTIGIIQSTHPYQDCCECYHLMG